MIIKSRLLGAVCAIPLVFVVSISNASFVSQSNLSFGVDSITLDTDTGLKWLDLTFSTNRTVADVSTQFGSGGDFEGFRYATHNEVDTFLINAGLPDVDSQSTGNFVPIQNFLPFVGYTVNNPSISVFYGTQGYLEELDQVSGKLLIHRAVVNTDAGLGSAELLTTSQISSSGSGHWLVQAVPIPGAVWLFGSGLLGLIGIAKRKKSV